MIWRTAWSFELNLLLSIFFTYYLVVHRLYHSLWLLFGSPFHVVWSICQFILWAYVDLISVSLIDYFQDHAVLFPFQMKTVSFIFTFPVRVLDLIPVTPLYIMAQVFMVNILTTTNFTNCRQCYNIPHMCNKIPWLIICTSLWTGSKCHSAHVDINKAILN